MTLSANYVTIASMMIDIKRTDKIVDIKKLKGIFTEPELHRFFSQYRTRVAIACIRTRDNINMYQCDYAYIDIVPDYIVYDVLLKTNRYIVDICENIAIAINELKKKSQYKRRDIPGIYFWGYRECYDMEKLKILIGETIVSTSLDVVTAQKTIEHIYKKAAGAARKAMQTSKHTIGLTNTFRGYK